MASKFKAPAQVVIDELERQQAIVTAKLEARPYQWNDLRPIQMTFNTTASTTGTITYTQDLVWNGWTVGNTTTGTSTFISDEQMVRFNAEGITFDWYKPTYTVNPIQEAVAQQWQVIHEREVPSPEELQRRADEAQRQMEEASRRRLEAEQRWARLEEDRILAQVRGLELLHMLLTDEQRAQYDLNAVVPVRGSEGGMYEIDTLQNGVHGNIVKVDEHGCRLGRVCVAPRMRVDGQALPLADGWVGQLLAIKTDERAFIRTGNWSSQRACAHPDVPILERAA